MPKVKTRSLAKKRFKKTANGKIKCAKAFRRHLLTRKNHKTKRHLRGGAYISSADLKNVKRMLPN